MNAGSGEGAKMKNDAGTAKSAQAGERKPGEQKAGMPIPEGVTRIAFDSDMIVPRLHAPLFGPDGQGSFVAVRPVAEKYEGRTYLGILLGDVALRVTTRKEDDTLTFGRSGFGNPCIFVPALNQLIYGMESWWGLLNAPEDLKQITDADIDNVWYVQALKALDGRDRAQEGQDDREAGLQP